MTPKKYTQLFVYNESNTPHDIAAMMKMVSQLEQDNCCQIIHDKLGIPATARASLGVYNSRDDIDKLSDAINNCKKIFKI